MKYYGSILNNSDLVNKEYVDGTTEVEVTINCDFSGVDLTTEFIAYICGHQHEDLVGYYEHSEEKQLCITVSAGIAYYGTDYTGMANYEDVPRDTKTSIQDLFNVYVIDRDDKKVRIARVGSNMNFQLKQRKVMYIPYKDLQQ